MRQLKKSFAVAPIVGLGSVLATLATLSACGANPSESAREGALSRVSDATTTPVPTPTPLTGAAGVAALMGTYEVKWCEAGVDLEPAFDAVVAKVANFCNQQNAELSNAGRFNCGLNSCTLRSMTQTGGPDHTLRISIGASTSGSLSLQFSIQPVSRPMPDWSDGNLFSCMDARLYASSRLNARELLQQKVFEGKALCGTTRPRPAP